MGFEARSWRRGATGLNTRIMLLGGLPLVAAAIITVVAVYLSTRHFVEAAIGTVQAPSHIAGQMNRRFRAADNDGRFLTMILCILDTHAGRLHFTSAGHPSPLVLRGNAIIPLPEAGGLPLAVIDDSDYEQGVVDLQPGDRVYLFSDGILEQMDSQHAEEFGLERLTALLTGMSADPADRVVAGVVNALTDWSGGKTFKDDVSLVMVEWLGGSSVESHR